MSRRLKSRRRKPVVDADLLDLYRAAQPASQRHWRAIFSGKEMTTEEMTAALAAIHAFDAAAGVRCFEHGPLDPRPSDNHVAMRATLYSMAEPDEVRQWRRFDREWCRHIDAEIAIYWAADERIARGARERQKSSPVP